MKFDYKVKYNGKWYLPGEEVESKKEADVSASSTVDRPFTKTDINRLTVDDLKSLAKKNNVPGYENMTGAALKEYFIDLLGL